MASKRNQKGGVCSAYGCSKRKGTNLLSEVKMFSFPTDPERRLAWTNALKRENWTPTKNSLLCNAHFISGKPSKDRLHPDYVPSQFSFQSKPTEQGQKNIKRYERSVKRIRRDSVLETSSTNDASNETNENMDSSLDVSFITTNKKNVEVQTDTDRYVENLEKKVKGLEEENSYLRKGTTVTRTYDMVINHNKKVFKFHTGLENMAMFNAILMYVLVVWQPDVKVSLKPCEQLLLCLMKMRLGLLNQDLACRFEIGVGTVSKVFHAWLNAMFSCLQRAITWPSKKQIKRNLPLCFREASLGKVRCTIDCTEIFIEKPHNFKARAQTFSNYKHHNTVKFLVGITPCGVISFISKVWGGRVSDKHLTAKSGLIDLLEKEDVLLADRGFKIEDLLASKGAKLLIPSSTRNKSQLSPEEVNKSRKMSKVRVHVERAIRKIKIFKILDSNLPISLVKTIEQEEYSTIDKIISVICALCNLSNPIIKR